MSTHRNKPKGKIMNKAQSNTIKLLSENIIDFQDIDVISHEGQTFISALLNVNSHPPCNLTNKCFTIYIFKNGSSVIENVYRKNTPSKHSVVLASLLINELESINIKNIYSIL